MTINCAKIIIQGDKTDHRLIGHEGLTRAELYPYIGDYLKTLDMDIKMSKDDQSHLINSKGERIGHIEFYKKVR